MFWGKVTQKSKPEKFFKSRKTISNVHAYFLCQNGDIFIKVFDLYQVFVTEWAQVVYY